MRGGITRPSEEVADSGPRAKFDFVPAMPGVGVIIIEDEQIIDNSRDGVAQGLGALQGLGVAQVVGDRQAQGDDDDCDDDSAIICSRITPSLMLSFIPRLTQLFHPEGQPTH